MRKFIQITIVLALIIAGFLVYQYVLPELRPPRGFLKITSASQSEVVLDGESLGNTPLTKSGLKVGSYNLILRSNLPTLAESEDNADTREVVLEKKVELEQSAVTVVNYNLAPNEAFHSGEILGLRKGAGISVVTSPEDSEVFLDGESLGKAPLSQIVDPGVRVLRVEKEGYITREIGVNIEGGFRLTAEVTLAKNPYPQTKRLSKRGRFILTDLSSEDSTLTEDYQTWAEAIWHFQNTGSDVPKEFDLLIDETGKPYELTDYSEKKSVGVGYLSSSAGKLSDEAKSTWENIAKGKSKGETSEKVLILDTPNGFLNVRSGPSTSDSILTRVKPGQNLNLIEEKTDWFKINYQDSKEGWISSQYAKKL